MVFYSAVIRVFIASPGDVAEERQICRDVIERWNAVHAERQRTVLLPVGWESHTRLDLETPAQDQIDTELLPICDMMIGIFWNRLGTPTGKSASGTVQEIENFRSAGKPVALYFSDRVPTRRLSSNELEQYRVVEEFKSKMISPEQGPSQRYQQPAEFGSHLIGQLSMMVRDKIDVENSVRSDHAYIRRLLRSKFERWNASGKRRHRLQYCCTREELDIAAELSQHEDKVRLFLLASAIQERYMIDHWLNSCRSVAVLPKFLHALMSTRANGRRPPLRAAWCAVQLGKDQRVAILQGSDDWDRPLEESLREAIELGDPIECEQAIEGILSASFPLSEVEAELRDLTGRDSSAENPLFE